MSEGQAEKARVDIPQWLLEARADIGANSENAGGAMKEPTHLDEPWDRGYWGGYYDACRHALKALPPFVKHPDDEDWIEEGFHAPDPEDCCPRCGCTDPPIRLRGIVLPVCPGCDAPVRAERQEP